MKPSKPIWLVALALLPFSACQKAGNTDKQSDVRLSQYMIEGKRLYLQHCSNCHQSDGQGFAKLYPPIAQSDFLQDTSTVICSIKNGLEGEIRVNGTTYNMKMPSNPKLTDLEIAEITTFIYNQWASNPKKMISTERVTNTLNSCSISNTQ